MSSFPFLSLIYLPGISLCVVYNISFNVIGYKKILWVHWLQFAASNWISKTLNNSIKIWTPGLYCIRNSALLVPRADCTIGIEVTRRWFQNLTILIITPLSSGFLGVSIVTVQSDDLDRPPRNYFRIVVRNGSTRIWLSYELSKVQTHSNSLVRAKSVVIIDWYILNCYKFYQINCDHFIK